MLELLNLVGNGKVKGERFTQKAMFREELSLTNSPWAHGMGLRRRRTGRTLAQSTLPMHTALSWTGQYGSSIFIAGEIFPWQSLSRIQA
jgi:hypothetical protein